MVGAKLLYGQGSGGVASNDQRFYMVIIAQRVPNGFGTFQYKGRIPLAIGRMGAVSHIDKVFIRQFALQGLQNAQAPHAAVKHPNRRVAVQARIKAHWLLSAMPLNSPEAMRLDHSAGPVMWALVPPASTATVTGMSTTSNS